MPLDPEVAGGCGAPEAAKSRSRRATLDVAGTRAMLCEAAAPTGTAPPPARMEDVVLPGSLRARPYRPALGTGLPPIVYFHGGRFFRADLDSPDTSRARHYATARESNIVKNIFLIDPSIAE
jgi:acetyl esterase/lipase